MLGGNIAIITGFITIFRKNIEDKMSFMDMFPSSALVSWSREMETLMPGLCSSQAAKSADTECTLRAINHRGRSRHVVE